MTAHLVSKSFGMLKPCGIFLGGDDAAGLRLLGKGFVDSFDVLHLELMVVAIGERGKVGNGRRQVVNHLLR